MPGPLAHVGMVALCPHGGMVMEVPSAPRVLLSGMPTATLADQYPIVACVFNVAGAPHPCIRVQWLVPAGAFFVTCVSCAAARATVSASASVSTKSSSAAL